MDVFFSVLILLVLTLASAYFSSAETALFSLSSTKIKAYQYNADPRKRLISKLVLQPRDLLVTIFMLNTLVNILIQNAASSMFGAAAGWGLKVGFPLVLMLVLGEIIPKSIGLQNNLRLSYLFAPSIDFLQNFLRPIRKAIIAVTAPISRFLFFYLRPEESISKEELKHVLKTSQEHGVLHHDEAEFVWGYLSLQDTLVKELMRPRDDILYYDISEPLSKLIYLFVDQECSRLPICDKSIQNIIGILSAKTFFLHRHELTSGNQLIPLLSKPYYVPETTPARILLRRFDEQNEVLAIVVDEYGSVSGLITQEDIIEVVIGEISDLRDVRSLYTQAGKNEIIASSRLELSEFNDLFQVDLTSESNMVTIGGWLIEQLGDIPKSGTKYEAHGFLFQVLAADPNRIRRLYIRKLNQKSPRKK
jgi:CBS domain containing-hemolysin-like protein